jgi:hypothetical protein
MSGILEAIYAELQAIHACLNSGAAQQPVAQQPIAQQPVPTQLPAPVDPFAAAPAAPAQVTEAQVMALIEPHLDNAAVKTALQGVLAQMGIARLPDARPDQYGDLYQRFSAVINQFKTQTAAPASII